MATFTKQLLAYSSGGRPQKIGNTSSPGDSVHFYGGSGLEEVWMWATNTSASAVKITVEFGGTTSPDDLIEVTIPAESGLYLVIPGLLYSSGSNIRVFAATANVINIMGYVNRIA